MLASKQPITSEWTLRRKDGTPLPVEVSGNILARTVAVIVASIVE